MKSSATPDSIKNLFLATYQFSQSKYKQKAGDSLETKCYDLTGKFIISINKQNFKNENNVTTAPCCVPSHHGTQQMTITAITANKITGTQMILQQSCSENNGLCSQFTIHSCFVMLPRAKDLYEQFLLGFP